MGSFSDLFGGGRPKNTPLELAQRMMASFDKAILLVVNESSIKQFVDVEKAILATNLFILGALDCCSQRAKLTDGDFGEFISTYFKAKNVQGPYIEILMRYFLNMLSCPPAMECVITGGSVCNGFFNGDTMVMLRAPLTIASCCENPDFPATPGHLAVKFM